MKYTNVASAATAEAIGMHKVKEFSDEVNGTTWVYAVEKNKA